MSATFPNAMLNESVDVKTTIKGGSSEPVIGPCPELPQKVWVELLKELQELADQAIPCTQDIDRLAAKWEDIAHTEAQPLFGRESKAGGKIETNISTMKEALSTKATLRPHPSFAAKILHRHSSLLAKQMHGETMEGSPHGPK